jgi:hypothetical protein
VNLDVNVVLKTYLEKIQELTSENLMLKAVIAHKEIEEKKAKEEETKDNVADDSH